MSVIEMTISLIHPFEFFFHRIAFKVNSSQTYLNMAFLLLIRLSCY